MYGDSEYNYINMVGCLFCKIANKEIRSEILYEDKDVCAFLDIKPAAPTHVIIIPTKHIDRISNIKKDDTELIGKMIFVASRIAREKNIDSGGYRIVINCNKDAGQEIFHIHLHLLGGRAFAWPPG